MMSFEGKILNMKRSIKLEHIESRIRTSIEFIQLMLHVFVIILSTYNAVSRSF